MATTLTRLTNSGTLYTSNYFDEFSGIPIADPSLQLLLDAGNSQSYPGTGTVWRDISGNGYLSTLTTSSSTLSNILPVYSPINGGYFSFNGINQYANTNYIQPAYQTSSSFTWNVWLNIPSSVGLTSTNALIGNRVYVTSPIYDFTKFDNSLRFEYYHTTYNNSMNVGTGINLNTWYNLCVVKNTSTIYYYVNGALTNALTSVINTSSGNAQIFYIGGDPNAGEFAIANISVVSVYNRALSPTEIITNYNAVAPRYNLSTISTTSVITSRIVTATTYLGYMDEVTTAQPMPIIDSTLAYWYDAGRSASYPLYNGTTVYDLSTVSNNAVITGVVAHTSSSTNYASYWTFDQTTNVGQIIPVNNYTTNASINFNNSAATFILWVYATTASANQLAPLFTRAGYGGSNMGATGLWIPSGSNLGYHWNNAGNTYSWVSGLVVPANTWTMIAITVAPNLATAYLCTATGISTATNAVSHPALTGGIFSLGGDVSLTRNWIGNINQALIYTRTLSATEIATIYNAGAWRFGLPTTSSGVVQASNSVQRAAPTGQIYVNNIFDEVTPIIVTNGTTLNLDAKQYPGSGPWADLSTTTDSIILNTTTFVTSATNYFTFNGINSYAYTQYSNPYPGPQTLSVGVWFQTTGATGRLIGYNATQGVGTTSCDRQLYIGTDGRVYYSTYTGTSIAVSSPSVYNNGTWHYAVATETASTSTNNLQLYVDGVLLATGSSYTTIFQSYAGYWEIGGGQTYAGGFPNSGSNAWFPGNMAMIQVYNRVLSPAEVAENFNQTRSRFGV